MESGDLVATLQGGHKTPGHDQSGPLCTEAGQLRLKREYDETQALGFGLIAEEVEKVDPALVYRNIEGQVESVRYEMVNAMLLNEFLKEHKKIEEQQTNITQLNSKMANQAAIIAQQQKEMEILTAQLKEQAAQIQKVSAQVALNRSATRTVAIGQ